MQVLYCNVVLHIEGQYLEDTLPSNTTLWDVQRYFEKKIGIQLQSRKDNDIKQLPKLKVNIINEIYKDVNMLRIITLKEILKNKLNNENEIHFEVSFYPYEKNVLDSKNSNNNISSQIQTLQAKYIHTYKEEITNNIKNWEYENGKKTLSGLRLTLKYILQNIIQNIPINPSIYISTYKNTEQCNQNCSIHTMIPLSLLSPLKEILKYICITDFDTIDYSNIRMHIQIILPSNDDNTTNRINNEMFYFNFTNNTDNVAKIQNILKYLEYLIKEWDIIISRPPDIPTPTYNITNFHKCLKELILEAQCHISWDPLQYTPLYTVLESLCSIATTALKRIEQQDNEPLRILLTKDAVIKRLTILSTSISIIKEIGYTISSDNDNVYIFYPTYGDTLRIQRILSLSQRIKKQITPNSDVIYAVNFWKNLIDINPNFRNIHIFDGNDKHLIKTQQDSPDTSGNLAVLSCVQQQKQEQKNKIEKYLIDPITNTFRSKKEVDDILRNEREPKTNITIRIEFRYDKIILQGTFYPYESISSVFAFVQFFLRPAIYSNDNNIPLYQKFSLTMAPDTTFIYPEYIDTIDIPLYQPLYSLNLPSNATLQFQLLSSNKQYQYPFMDPCMNLSILKSLPTSIKKTINSMSTYNIPFNIYNTIQPYKYCLSRQSVELIQNYKKISSNNLLLTDIIDPDIIKSSLPCGKNLIIPELLAIIEPFRYITSQSSPYDKILQDEIIRIKPSNSISWSSLSYGKDIKQFRNYLISSHINIILFN